MLLSGADFPVCRYLRARERLDSSSTLCEVTLDRKMTNARASVGGCAHQSDSQWWAEPTLREAEQRGPRGCREAANRSEGGGDSAGLVAAVDHAVAAFRVAALMAIGGPVGGFHQLAKGMAIAFAKQ